MNNRGVPISFSSGSVREGKEGKGGKRRKRGERGEREREGKGVNW